MGVGLTRNWIHKCPYISNLSECFVNAPTYKPHQLELGDRIIMKIVYARDSTGDQNLDMQMDSLEFVGCDQVFTDKMSGARSSLNS